MIAAIIASSVEDLTSPDKAVRDDAQAFWQPTFGEKARWRRDLLAMLDIDDTVARNRVAHLLDEPPRARQYTRPGPANHEIVLNAMPDGEVTVAQIAAACPDLDAAQVRSALTHLRTRDDIRMTCKKRGGSLYAKTSWVMAGIAA